MFTENLWQSGAITEWRYATDQRGRYTEPTLITDEESIVDEEGYRVLDEVRDAPKDAMAALKLVRNTAFIGSVLMPDGVGHVCLPRSVWDVVREIIPERDE